MNAPPGPGRVELTQRLVADLGGAFQMRAAYAATHPQVKASLSRVLSAMAAWCAHEGTSEVSLFVLEGHLLVDRLAAVEEAPWTRGLLRAFLRHRIRGLTLVGGLNELELGSFLDGCQAGKTPTGSRHILVGQVGRSAPDAAEGGEGPAPTPGGAPATLPHEQVQGAQEELRAVAVGAVTRVDRLRALVARLARAAEAGSLESLRAPTDRIDDREFLHGLAVSLATLRLARALRIEGRTLEDLALAGLVHDVGYLEAAEPDEDPARRRDLHPIRGAARLAALEGMPDVAVRVAYEHHLRFDGAPNYRSMSRSRRPIAAARVVAVADTWETLRSRRETRPDESIAILRGRAGTFLDPALVALLAEVVLPKAT